MRTMNDSLEEMGMKDHPSGSKELDVNAIEDPKLVSTVETRLDNLAKMTGRVPGKNPAVSDVDDDDPNLDDDLNLDDGDEEDNDDNQAASDDIDDDSTPDEDSTDVDGDMNKGKEVKIPDAYIRAAKGNGWKEEDIEEFVKISPETALKTFENLHNSWNKASREWAAIGRAAQKSREETPEIKSEDKLEYGGVDIAALKKEFDLDPAVERMLESVNARDAKLTDALNTLIGSRTVKQDNSRERQAALNYDLAAEAAQEQQINSFFTTDDMKPYNKFYGELKFGETWENLPPGQARNRFAVYRTADQLLAGAAMQAQPMQLSEALERAHLLVTEGMRESIIRSEIKKASTKRKHSMVFRPSEGKSRKGDGSGKPKTKNELENKVAGFIKKALAK